MRVVSTVKWGWTVRDIVERQTAAWASANPGAWVAIRCGAWLVLHPLRTAGGLVALWLWARGWPLWLSAPAGAVLPAAGKVAEYWGVLAPPVGGCPSSHSSRRGLSRIRGLVARVRRRRTLMRRWDASAAAAGIKAGSGDQATVPRLLRVRATVTGLSAEVNHGAVHVTADRVAKGALTLAASIPGCRQVTAVAQPDPGWSTLQFMWSDPLARVVKLSQLPLPARDRLAFGVTETGEPAAIDRQLSVFIAGLTGSGKSTVLWALLASALATGVPVRLWVIDPAGGVELHALRNSPLVRSYGVLPGTANGKGNYETGTAQRVISEAHAAMFARLDAMSGTTRLHKPTGTEPLEVLIIDEMLRLKSTISTASHAKLRDIVSIGRKAAFTVWALAQLTQKEDVGSVRDLFPQRICLATPNEATTDAFLGMGAESAGARCSKIRTSEQGMGFAVLDGMPGFTRFRGAWVPDADTDLIGRGHLPTRVPRRDGAVPLAERAHVLYGWYAPDLPSPDHPDWDAGELLYLGISHDGPARAHQHLRDGRKEWASEPGVKMRILERFDSRDAALAAEKAAIIELHPRYNVVHSRRPIALGPTANGGPHE